MRNFNKILTVAAVAVLGFSADSFAQASVSATAGATATIVTPIQIVKNLDMNFGNLAVNATTGGDVILAVDNSRTESGGITLPVTTGTPTAAKFTVTGQSGYVFDITFTVADFLLTKTGGGPVITMLVDDITTDFGATGTLTGGTQVLLIGGTLNVAAGQSAGTYANTTALPLSVDYN